MGLTTILSNRSKAIESFYLRSTYSANIINGNFTLVFLNNSESYLEISKFRTETAGSHSIRYTFGFDTANPFYQQLFNSIGVGLEINTWNTNSNFIMPPGSSFWIDNRSGTAHTLTITGTRFKVTP